jgi:membrane carboxypeptidase/penicillin-binding protein
MSTRFLPTPLSNAFFSDFNRETIHNNLISKIKDETGYVIDRQNDADIQGLMRKVYVNMAGNEYDNVKNNVGTMNSKVIDEASQFVLTGVLQQIVYLQDISTNPVPLSMPVSTSTYGNKLPINDRYGINPR